MLAGAGAGLASTVAGHPFDTIKVRLQTQRLGKERVYRNALDCGVQMVRNEGPFSLFKGMSTPLVARGLINAICFYSYSRAMGVLHDPSAGVGSRPPLHSVFLAGAFAGVTTTFVTSPSELVKIRLQLDGRPGASTSTSTSTKSMPLSGKSPTPLPSFAGPLRGTMAMLRREGLGSLYSGTYATACREFLAVGGFFLTVESVRRFSKQAFPDAPPPLTATLSVLGGALAGMAGWTLCYPLDVWKSRLQEGGDRPGFVRFAASRIRGGGALSLYAGLGPTLLRAVPVNAAKFFTFDLLLRLLPGYLADTTTQ